MSIKYADALKKNPKIKLKEFLKRPGKMDADGKPLYTTEQHHKKECDINYIIDKYDKTGVIKHVSKFEGKFGDMTGMDFQAMQFKIAQATNMFNELPAEIRSQFANNPANLLSFMEDENNRPKAIKMGLIREDWTEETDGLGEHVPEGGNIQKSDSIKETQPKPKNEDIQTEK